MKLLNLIICLCSASMEFNIEDQVYDTANGRVSGFMRNNVEIFWGIPFAAPPVNENRWRSPQPPERWDSVLRATRIKPSCPQSSIVDTGILSSEDCLYLNIYKPASAENLPVVYFIHGGGFLIGDSYLYGVYDAEKLAREANVIVVTAAYRLGALGTIAAEGISGNFAIPRSACRYGMDPNEYRVFWR